MYLISAKHISLNFIHFNTQLYGKQRQCTGVLDGKESYSSGAEFQQILVAFGFEF